MLRNFFLYFFFGHTFSTSFNHLFISISRLFLHYEQQQTPSLSLLSDISKLLYCLLSATLSVVLSRLLFTDQRKWWTRLCLVHFLSLLIYKLVLIFNKIPAETVKTQGSNYPNTCDKKFDDYLLVQVGFSTILEVVAFICFFYVFGVKRVDYNVLFTQQKNQDG